MMDGAIVAYPEGLTPSHHQEAAAMKFTTNVGSADRIARIIVGLVLLSLTVIGPKTMWGLVGLIPLATAFMRFCPLYPILGVNTNKRG